MINKIKEFINEGISLLKIQLNKVNNNNFIPDDNVPNEILRESSEIYWNGEMNALNIVLEYIKRLENESNEKGE